MLRNQLGKGAEANVTVCYMKRLEIKKGRKKMLRDM